MYEPDRGLSAEASGQPEVVVPERPRVFVAEDDEEMRELVRLSLTTAGYEVLAFQNGALLLEALASCITRDGLLNVDMIITDIRMPGPTGLRVLAMFREYDKATPIIVMTAFGGDVTRAEAMRLGATVVLDKPVDLDDLCAAVRQLAPLPT